MSTVPDTPAEGKQSAWESIAERQDVLEMVIEEDAPFASQAETLLSELEKRGLREC